MTMLSEITVDELADKLVAGVHLVDVRETDEYSDGHIAGALSAPLTVLPDMLHQFRHGVTNYIVCKSGGRSARACEWLAAQGYNAVNIIGGTIAWQLSGRDVVAGEQPA